MSANLTLLQKLLLEMIPSDAKPGITTCFEALKVKPMEQTLSFCHQMGDAIRNDHTEGHGATINGMMIGLALAHMSTAPEFIQFINGYLKRRADERGENVVDFFQKKAGKS